MLIIFHMLSFTRNLHWQQKYSVYFNRFFTLSAIVFIFYPSLLDGTSTTYLYGFSIASLFFATLLEVHIKKNPSRTVHHLHTILRGFLVAGLYLMNNLTGLDHTLLIISLFLIYLLSHILFYAYLNDLYQTPTKKSAAVLLRKIALGVLALILDTYLEKPLSSIIGFPLILILLCWLLFSWRDSLWNNWTDINVGLCQQQHLSIWAPLWKKENSETFWKILARYHQNHPKDDFTIGLKELSLINILTFFESAACIKNGIFGGLIKRHINTLDERAVWMWEIYPSDRIAARAIAALSPHSLDPSHGAQELALPAMD